MDKLKSTFGVLAKHGFWIVSGIVFLSSVVIWFLSTSQLSTQSAEQTANIESKIQTVSSVQSELSELPNEHSHKEMQRMISDRQDEVLRSWKRLYDRQRNLLTWPVAELKQDFVDEYEGKIPIEVYVEFPTAEADELETTLLSRYATYIKNILPAIAEIGNTEWTAEFERSGGMSMMESSMDFGGGFSPSSRTSVDITGAEQGPLVKWESSSQQQVLKDLFPWRGQQPTTLEVYYSQENIWILKQLLSIVSMVNGDAQQPYQAKIHEIKRLAIGDSVEFGAGNISKPGSTAGGMGMMGGMMDEMMGDMMMEMMSEMSGSGGAVVTLDPADNRYVNEKFEPIMGARLRQALTSNLPDDASLAVAKRVPVMMSFNMDQRAVHELLAACGSAPLMVQVRQVRVLPKNAAAGGMSDDGGMGMEDEGGMEMEMEMMMGGGGGMGGPGMNAPTAPEELEEFPLDMNVEVYGIIHIYNPPDPIKLGVEQVTEDTVIEGENTTLGGEAVQPEAPATQEGELPTPTPDGTTPTAPADPAATPPVTATSPPNTPTAILPTAN